MIVVELLKRPMTAAQLVAVSKNLGHSDIAMTLRHYANMSEQEIFDQLRKLENQLARIDDRVRILIDRANAHAISPEDPDFYEATRLAAKHNENLRLEYKY